jgi:hypothetical protein
MKKIFFSANAIRRHMAPHGATRRHMAPWLQPKVFHYISKILEIEFYLMNKTFSSEISPFNSTKFYFKSIGDNFKIAIFYFTQYL